MSAWRASTTLEQAERVGGEHEGRDASGGDHKGSNQNPHNFEVGHCGLQWRGSWLSANGVGYIALSFYRLQFALGRKVLSAPG